MDEKEDGSAADPATQERFPPTQAADSVAFLVGLCEDVAGLAIFVLVTAVAVAPLLVAAGTVVFVDDAHLEMVVNRVCVCVGIRFGVDFWSGGVIAQLLCSTSTEVNTFYDCIGV